MKRFLIVAALALLVLPAVVQGADGKEAIDNPVVVMETDKGEITIELFAKEAPESVANFLQYVNEGFYDGLIFHRVIPGFVIQGGGFMAGMKSRPATHPPVKNEADNGLANKRGTLSMARTNRVNSATSQFFVNVRDNASLDHRGPNPNQFGYAVFGRVTKGMDVVDAIVAVPTTTVGQYRDVPKMDVVIKRAYEVKMEQPADKNSVEKE